MDKVFVDASAWIALLAPGDNLRQQANAVYAQLERENVRLYTTEFVLLEVADALSVASFRHYTIDLIESLRRNQRMTVIPFSQSLLEAGWALYKQRPDKDWGLTDCISFVTMQRQDMARVFTSDQHFAQAGFVKLLQN